MRYYEQRMDKENMDNKLFYYCYDELIWMGPGCENLHKDIKVFNVMPIGSNVPKKRCFIPEKGKFLLYTCSASYYESLKEDEKTRLIIGPSSSYKKCFKLLMDNVCEIINQPTTSCSYKPWACNIRIYLESSKIVRYFNTEKIQKIY